MENPLLSDLLLLVVVIQPLSVSYFCAAAAADSTGFYVWPSTWVVVNNASLPNSSTHYRSIIDTSGHAIVTPGASSYGFGFIQLNSNGSFFLCVALGVGLQTASASAVWIANLHRPVQENASVRIGPLGNMVLLDWDGTEVWNSGAGRVRAVALRSSGQLEFFNSTNSSTVDDAVWQSWASPMQMALVKDQSLLTDGKLVSNSSFSKSSEVIYSMSVEAAGIVLYMEETAGSVKKPYWVWGFPGFESYSSIRHPCFLNSSLNRTVSRLVYSNNSLIISYEGNPIDAFAEQCAAVNRSLSIRIPFGSSSEESMYRFIRLDDDGNLRVYKIDNSTKQNGEPIWVVDHELFKSRTIEECNLPNVCGAYGICADGDCVCPKEFKPLNPLRPRDGCTRSQPFLCDGTGFQHFLKVEDVEYFLNTFSTPEPHASSTEQCEKLCSNCSCMAFFFDHNSNSCFLAENLRSLVVAHGRNFTAYLKVENGSLPFSVSISVSYKRFAIFILLPFAVILACCGVLVTRKIILKNARRSAFVDPDEDEEKAFLEALPGLPPRMRLEEVQVATGDFMKRLGRGGFGSVYEGLLKDGTRVAIKRLHGGKQGHKEFRAEVATIGSINHANLIRLRAFCAERGERLLVYELMENGSLDKWIFRSRQPDPNDEQKEKFLSCATELVHNLAASNACLSWEKRVAIALGTAKGLAYLHEDCREPILHLDIKPQNILLDDNFMPKVADFGMARLMEGDATQVVTAVRGTPGYLAPEWLRASIASTKCDVYSFGMLLLELISGRKNFNLTVGSDPSLYDFPAWAKLRALEGKYMDLLDEKLKREGMEKNLEEIVRLINIAFCCIQEDPQVRPSMTAVVSMLEGAHGAIFPNTSVLEQEDLSQACLSTQGPHGAACNGIILAAASPPDSSMSYVHLSGPR